MSFFPYIYQQTTIEHLFFIFYSFDRECRRHKMEMCRTERRRARVVKGMDSKSIGVTRAGSNPVDVVTAKILVNVINLRDHATDKT